MPAKAVPTVDVCVLLTNQHEHVLLGKRKATGFGDDMYGIPGGHLEVGESATQGAARELNEEVGVVLQPDELTCSHVAHHHNGQGKTRIGCFFTARTWQGTVTNREPDLCAGLSWHHPDQLPDTTIPYIATIIARIQEGQTFSVHGW